MFEFIRRASPLWGNASFNRLWAAQILSAFGSRITRTALPIIAVSLQSRGRAPRRKEIRSPDEPAPLAVSPASSTRT